MLKAFDLAITYAKFYSEDYLNICAKIHVQGAKNWILNGERFKFIQ